MDAQFDKYWVIILVIIVLGMPVGAVQANDMLKSAQGLNSDKAPVANNMTFGLHVNTNSTGKLNGTNAKTYDITVQPAHGTLSLNKTSGKFVYVPSKDFIGTDSFQYKVNNGTKNSSSGMVKISISNNVPVANNANYKGCGACNSQLTASDIDNDTLTYKIVSKTNNGTITLNPNGTYIYVPSGRLMMFGGTDQFTYIANDGINDSNVATVTINMVSSGTPVPLHKTFLVIDGHYRAPYWPIDPTVWLYSEAYVYDNTTGQSVNNQVLRYELYNPNGALCEVQKHKTKENEHLGDHTKCAYAEFAGPFNGGDWTLKVIYDGDTEHNLAPCEKTVKFSQDNQWWFWGGAD